MKSRVLVNGQAFEVAVLASSTSRMELEVDGRVYEIEFEESVPAFGARIDTARPLKAAASGSQISKDMSGGVVAPMAGVITAILVSTGDEVSPGQPVLRYEAMKMDNLLVAPRQGLVGEIFVVVGQEISGGQTLLALDL